MNVRPLHDLVSRPRQPLPTRRTWIRLVLGTVIVAAVLDTLLEVLTVPGASLARLSLLGALELAGLGLLWWVLAKPVPPAAVSADLTARNPAGADLPNVDDKFGRTVQPAAERTPAYAALRRESGFIELLQKVAVAANEAADVGAALHTALADICRHTGWPVGHAYGVTGDGTAELVSARIWYLADPVRLAPFRRVSEELRLGPGASSLLGRAYVSGKAEWLLDAGSDPSFTRSAVAREVGIRSGFAVPLLLGTEVVGALEFFSGDPVDPDRRLLQIMDQIGTQLSRVIERQRAAEALQRSERKYRDIVELAPIGVYQCTQRGCIVTANQAFAQMLGYRSPEEMEGINLGEHGADGRTRLRAAAGGGDRTSGVEVRWKRRDGTPIWVQITAREMGHRHGNGVAVEAFIQDVSERHHAVRVLRTSRERLAALSRQLFATQEIERAHLARELHDHLGQLMTAIKLNLEAAQRDLNGGNTDRVGESIALIDQGIREIRSLSLDLRPSVLDDLGLEAALRWYVRRQADRAGIEVTLRGDLSSGPLSADVQTACFRIIQEAVTNVVRHAAAHRMVVEFRAGENGVDIAVRDDGVGFDLRSARRGPSPERGLGLLGMEERAALAGGVVEVDSTPGTGTEVRVRFPQVAVQG